jgi:hypothetical protein
MPERLDFRDLMVATAGLSGRAGAPKLQWLYALRGDFADRAFRHPAFKDAVGEGNEFLADMRPDELRDAIRKPAAALDVEFEGGTDTQPGLVWRIAQDAGDTVGSLPLMQHILEELWEGMHERRLTHKVYEELGELTGALDRHAEAVYAALTTEAQQLVPRLFSRLVNLREDGRATRRIAWRQELEQFDPGLWALAVQLATDVERTDQEPLKSRLLAIGGTAGARTSEIGGTERASIAPMTAARERDSAADGRVEVAHEALLGHWSRLRDWISQQRDFLLWRNRLDRRIAELDGYLKSNTQPHFRDIPSEYLLRGTHLAEAIRWWEARPNDLVKEQVEFLETSRHAAKVEQQRLAKERQEKADAARRQAELEAELQRLRRYVTPAEQRIVNLSAIENSVTETVKTPPLEFTPTHSSPESWAVEAIGAHQCPFTGIRVTIGCIDTGIDLSHPVFADLEIVQRNFPRDENNSDWDSHGTAIASVILGRTVNGVRVGVAPGVRKLVVAKIASPSSDSLLQALLWLHDQRVNIIHIGFGMDLVGYADLLIQHGTGPRQAFAKTLSAHQENSRLFARAIDVLRNSDRLSGGGTLIFAPAGNESRVDDRVPVTSPIATADGVISVGSVARGDRGLEAAAFTNSGPRICAPGVDVPVAKLGGGFSTMSGTTLSCAIAVGTAALWWEYARVRGGTAAANAWKVEALMLASATRDGFVPSTNQELLGHGLIVAPTDAGELAAVQGNGAKSPGDASIVGMAPVVPLTSE